MEFAVFLILAIILDWFIGDPRWLPHPVRFIGKLCVILEKVFRSIFPNDKVAGCLTTITVLCITLTTLAVLLLVSGGFSLVIQSGIAILFIYFFIAIKDLLRHSDEVYKTLEPQEDIDKARKAIGRIVGRDTATLNRQDICKACVETVSENLVDGITAPLFWAVLFSFLAPHTALNEISLAALGITFYKTINTMDSMFGYKNDRYIDFGWLPARIDDLVNFVPARLTGLGIVAAAFLTNMDWCNSYAIYRRDRLNHSSPNAGHPEAAVAGALKLQLGGPSYYFGKKVDKPFIGDKIQDISAKHILKTNKIVLVTALLFLLVLIFCQKIIFISFSYMANL